MSATSLLDVWLLSILYTMPAEQQPLANTELPRDVAEALRQATESQQSPETLADAIAAVESMLTDEECANTVDRMYQPAETRHAVQFGDRTEHVPCVLDALIVGLVVDASPVAIRSDPPNEGQTVHLTVADSEISMEPSTATFSWGIANQDAQTSDVESTLQNADTVSIASCSYINAFPDVTAYHRWESQVSDAAVMQLDASAMVALAERAANIWVAE